MLNQATNFFLEHKFEYQFLYYRIYMIFECMFIFLCFSHNCFLFVGILYSMNNVIYLSHFISLVLFVLAARIFSIAPKFITVKVICFIAMVIMCYCLWIVFFIYLSMSTYYHMLAKLFNYCHQS